MESCFGGYALYAAAALGDCTHDPAADDCEHVSLHACMRARGAALARAAVPACGRSAWLPPPPRARWRVDLDRIAPQLEKAYLAGQIKPAVELIPKRIEPLPGVNQFRSSGNQ